jgi:hypothetical protein
VTPAPWTRTSLSSPNADVELAHSTFEAAPMNDVVRVTALKVVTPVRELYVICRLVPAERPVLLHDEPVQFTRSATISKDALVAVRLSADAVSWYWPNFVIESVLNAASP